VRRRHVTTVLALALTAAAGCGQSDSDAVRSTVTDFRKATADRDYGRICKDILAKDLVRRLDALGLPCESALSKYLADTHDPKVEVRSVKVKGKHATANVRSSAQGQTPSQDTLGLVQEDGSWRISSLGS
jgi:Putative lumazine-binding